MSDLIEDLRADLEEVVTTTPAPRAAELVHTATARGRRIRARRRTAVAAVSAACVASVVLPLALRSGDPTSTTEPATSPSSLPSTSSPSAPEPTASATAGPSRSATTWRVTERCHPAPGNVCGRFRVVEIEVDGVVFRNLFGGEAPLNPPNRSIELRVGGPHVDSRVLGGVVSRSGTTVSYRLYVDGRMVRHYSDGRVRLLPVPAGRHEVRLVADASVTGGRTSIAVADFRRAPPRS